jgi:PPOX class probable FMN-dependent enzyme
MVLSPYVQLQHDVHMIALPRACLVVHRKRTAQQLADRDLISVDATQARTSKWHSRFEQTPFAGSSLLQTRRHVMQINTLEELRHLYDQPVARVIRKDIGHIDQHIGRFIGLSPFMVMSSGDVSHQLDASPRGGEPGFVKVVNEHTLAIPDSPGNNRLDTLENILSSPQVGLLFMIPGVEEMARVNGRASLQTEPALLDLWSEGQRRPKLVIQVSVQEAYLHCAKAIMRSKVWDSQAQVDRAVLPSMGEMLKSQLNLEGPAESRDEMRKRYLPIL